MAKLTMAKMDSKYGAPQGTYVAKYLGTVEKTHPEYGAGLEWQFKILGGVFDGKIISRTTAMEPTTKNSCGAMLRQLSGGAVEVGEEVDEAKFINHLYTVMVGPNSTGNGTRIETLMPFTGTPPTVPPTQPQASAPKPPAPTAPGKAAPPKPPTSADTTTERRFWVILPPQTEPVEMGEAEVSRWLVNNKMSNAAVQAMTLDQSSGWKTAADFGIEDSILF